MNVKNILSSVFSNLTPSSTLYINETVNQRWQRGEQLFHMGFGESRFDVHPKLQQALTSKCPPKKLLAIKRSTRPLYRRRRILFNQTETRC